MNLVELLKKTNKRKNTIQGIDLYFSKVTWGQYLEFQSLQEKLSESGDEHTNTIKLCYHIFDKFVTDEHDEKVVESEEALKELPIEFCLDVLNVFSDSISGETSQIKK